MRTLFLHQLPIAITIMTLFTVLIHDTQLDSATTTALAVPIVVAYASDVASKFNDTHPHTQRVSVARELRSVQPRVQPRNDDKKYVLAKRSQTQPFGSVYSWPSI